MVREIYLKTMKLEEALHSRSIHLLDKRFDPIHEIMNIFEIPEEQAVELSSLIGLYIEGEITLPELTLAFEEKVTQVSENAS